MREPGVVSGGSSEDAFARIDLVSNHTVFRNREHYVALLEERDLPIDMFSSFIHEATHHWCFVSPVGTALALLYLSVAKNALRWIVHDDESGLEQGLDDLCTFDVAVSWLRPLSEGLAQFAEYDVVPPTHESLMSPPLFAALNHLFHLPQRLARGGRNDPAPILYALADDISRWRLSRQTIDRKSELLLQPVRAQGSAYLLGYLTVKQLWRNAGRFYRELRDADVFMMFLRKLVFGDYAVVDAILDRSKPGPQRGVRVGQAIHARLHAIRLMPFDEDVPWSVWKTLLETPERDGLADLDVADGTPFSALDTQDAVKNGRKLQLAFFHEVAKPVDYSSAALPVAFPPDYFFHLLRERHLFWLGDVSATWRSVGKQKGDVLVGGRRVFEQLGLTKASDEGLDALTLDIYVDLYEGSQVTALGNERGVFAVAVRSPRSKTAYDRIMELKLDRRQTVALTDMLHQVVRGYAQGTNYHAVLADFWDTTGRSLLDDTYMGFAFDFDKQAESLIADRGLADVLQEDPELIRSVAAISLAASLELTPEGLVSYNPDLAVSPAEAARRVKELWRCEWPLASIDRDGFLSSAL